MKALPIGIAIVASVMQKNMHERHKKEKVDVVAQSSPNFVLFPNRAHHLSKAASVTKEHADNKVMPVLSDIR